METMLRGLHSESGDAGGLYYADLRVTEVVFANEWDKQILITALGSVKKLFGAEVYAFCVLDDRLRLMLGGARVRMRTVRLLLSTLIERFLAGAEKVGEADAMPQSAVTTVSVIRIEDEKDAVQVMRYIHLTPSSAGYALSAADYWWTSYSTYRGRYFWQVVDSENLMKFLEKQDSSAPRSLLDFHRRAEAMRNPAPACVRAGTFHVLDWRRDYIPSGIDDEKFNETFGA